MKEILEGFEWNEALPNEIEILHSSLVSLLSFAPDRTPAPIGTAFIVGSYGNHAVAISAAHNFWLGVKQAQDPNPAHHPTAIPEFLKNYEEIRVDRRSLRATYQVGNRIEVCVIGCVLWEKRTDLALLTLVAQDIKDRTVFQHHFSLVKRSPSVGDIVGVVGYGDMTTTSESRDGSGKEEFVMSRRLVLRVGKVKAIYPDGHVLCRGPCFETNIPVFGGMSGGPVFLIPEGGQDIVPLGVISSDLENSTETKNDRSQGGVSIVAMLTHEIVDDTEERRTMIFRFSEPNLAQNPEFSGELNYNSDIKTDNASD